MSQNNKSYRARTNIKGENKLNILIDSDYDILEILSLKIRTENIYKLHTSHYGCVVGRVLANGGVGVPNAKISIFIEADETTIEDDVLYNIYPYSTTHSKNSDGIRYNLLPDEQVSMCHQAVGTMPNKRLVLDDKNILEIFDKYYKYTTVTNSAGDYMIMGMPVGNQTIHMDVDLSDIGFLSQKPIDMFYKGYNASQFENAQQFKKSTNLNNLAQIITQDSTIYVNPFWGDSEADEIAITRHDIDVNYKFEPTCVFMGSLVSDNSSNGFSKTCVPTPDMGRMDKLITSSGTIEMIRKRPDGNVEEFSINGNELIDGNGVWCYQIPMNLDYVTTDEYGNIIPTEDPEKGIPTRTRVRFRVSLNDSFETEQNNNHLVKVLIPNNPQNEDEVDYTFGSLTKDEEDGSSSFRDLMWNNVYTVKSHIPRIQKGNNQRTKKFSGIKRVNVHGDNNPIPYNNMRVNITFMFVLQCAIIKTMMFFIKIINKLIMGIRGSIGTRSWMKCVTIGDGLCPDLENWYFAPGCYNNGDINDPDEHLLHATLDDIKEKELGNEGSIGSRNLDKDENTYCVTQNTNYFMQCVEINLAMENDVIQFDFYNDWINGLLYIPRWFVKIRKKGSFFFGLIKIKPKTMACLEDSFRQTRRYTQQCAMEYRKGDTGRLTKNISKLGCRNNSKQKCHKSHGRKSVKIFGTNGGIVHKEETIKQQKVYYAKPCEWKQDTGRKVPFFMTDIVLLGSINENNIWGIPSEFDGLQTSTFQMPPNLVQTNMDSDGVLYGIAGNGKAFCTNTTIQKSGIKEVEQTFSAYEEWVMDKNEKPEPDVTEYAVSEISGIDWGFAGPNQKGSNLGDLFFPGGHFLGIACLSAEVNIKSCVNLSRICELGALMSQRQSEPKKENNNDYVYEYLIPNGFISKLELAENNYRNIFATLNHNGLKTKKDGVIGRKYDFISMFPNNFNGELKSRIENNNTYNRTMFDNNNDVNAYPNATAYTRAFEDCSNDYYDFRMGYHAENEKEKKEEFKHYLLGTSVVSLPIHNNSFYFYYGLKNGNSALDKFMSDYHAECPKASEQIGNEPHLEIVFKTNPIYCEKNGSGTIKIVIKNYDGICKYTLTRNNQIIDGKKDVVIFNNNIEIESGLTEGNYFMVVTDLDETINLTLNFEIKNELPISGDTYNEYNVTQQNFTLKQQEIKNPILIERKQLVFNDLNDMLKSVVFNNITSYDKSKKPPYVYAIIAENGGYYTYHPLFNKDNNERKIIEEALNSTNGFNNILLKEFSAAALNNINDEGGLISFKTPFFLNKQEGKLSLIIWGEGVYNIYLLLSCSKLEYNEEGGNYNINEPFLVLKEKIDIDIPENSAMPYYYIYDSEIPYSEITSCLAKLGSDEHLPLLYTGISKDVATILIDKLEKIENPEVEYKVKRALIYNKSVHEGINDVELNYGFENVTPPYKVTYWGKQVTPNAVDDIAYITSATTENNETITSSLPTKGWMLGDDISEEIQIFLDKNVSSDCLKAYYYKVVDANGFGVYIITDNNAYNDGDSVKPNDPVDPPCDPDCVCENDYTDDICPDDYDGDGIPGGCDNHDPEDCNPEEDEGDCDDGDGACPFDYCDNEGTCESEGNDDGSGDSTQCPGDSDGDGACPFDYCDNEGTCESEGNDDGSGDDCGCDGSDDDCGCDNNDPEDCNPEEDAGDCDDGDGNCDMGE